MKYVFFCFLHISMPIRHINVTIRMGININMVTTIDFCWHNLFWCSFFSSFSLLLKIVVVFVVLIIVLAMDVSIPKLVTVVVCVVVVVDVVVVVVALVVVLPNGFLSFDLWYEWMKGRYLE